MLAPNLKPNEIFLDKYEINSIKTKRGNSPKGQPAGTKREKKRRPCFWKPSIVAPKTIVKLSEKVNIKCEVDAKLYGINPIKLLTKINRNNAYTKGKYICPLFALIWFTTILYTVKYKVSWLIDQLFGTILSLLVANKLYIIIIKLPIIKYNPILVNEKWLFPKKLTLIENKSLISNWSNGLNIVFKFCIIITLYIYLILIYYLH
jgi:hypothetical protein